MLQTTPIYQRNLFRLLIFLSSIIFAVYLFLRLHIIPFHTIEIGGVEINVIDGIVKILSGNFLYTDPAEPPYDVMQYSPVYYYLVAGIAKLLNISHSDPHNIFMLSRSVGLLSNLMTGLVVYLTARHFNLSKKNSFLAGIFTFIIQTQHYYSRGDGFYCFLFFLALLVFLKYMKSEKKVVLIFFSIISFLCIFTKQSGILLPAIAGLFLLTKKNFRAIIIVAVTFLCMTELFVLLSSKMGGMDAIYRNVILGVKNGITFKMLGSFFNDIHYIELSLWIIIGFYLSIKIFKTKFEQQYYFILLFLFSSLLFAFITLLKHGASINYFVECFILAFLAGLIYIKDRGNNYLRIVLYSYFLVSIFLRTAETFSAVYISKFRFDDLPDYLSQKEVADFLINDRHIGKDDLVYLDFRGYAELFLHGNSIMNQKDVNYYTNKYASPQIDYSNLLQNADKGMIKYLITRDELADVKLLEKHFYNFSLVKKIDGYKIFQYGVMESFISADNK